MLRYLAGDRNIFQKAGGSVFSVTGVKRLFAGACDTRGDRDSGSEQVRDLLLPLQEDHTDPIQVISL